MGILRVSLQSPKKTSESNILYTIPNYTILSNIFAFQILKIF